MPDLRVRRLNLVATGGGLRLVGRASGMTEVGLAGTTVVAPGG